MNIIVCGSIGYGGIEDIRRIQKFLIKNGFNVIDHISEEGMDYSNIDDFRDNKELAERIVKHDFSFVDKSDIIVVVLTRPSFGTAMEMMYAKSISKTVLLLAEHKVPTPWPIYYSDYVVKSKEELLKILKKL